MQQIFKRNPQLYWNRTSAWVLSCKFAAYFHNTFSQKHLWRAASVYVNLSREVNFLVLSYQYITLFFFIRTSKFCLSLAVLNFFFIFETEMFLICSYFPDWNLQCHKEEYQTEYNKTTLFHFFHFFSFTQRT